ncbi:MAG: cache domain-containing protein [Deltaproteobacteria bacterium]|nr:cache domain-containing protein [Candidatus Anaeroferrophillacea bacterium]
MKTVRQLQVIIVFLVVLAVAAGALAGDTATRDECVAKAKAAAQLVLDEGLDAALGKINDKSGSFVWKNSYVFCIDLDKQCNIAHPIKPKLIGKNLMAVKDVNNKMFFAEFISLAKTKGEGWVDYMWPKPGEKAPSRKLTYVYRVPGHNIAMLAGIYE